MLFRSWGSDDHVADLEARCSDAAYWRDKYPKGSERRGHFRNVYNTLRKELQSAKKRNQLHEKQCRDEWHAGPPVTAGGKFVPECPSCGTPADDKFVKKFSKDKK